jgi:hypothetical protein
MASTSAYTRSTTRTMAPAIMGRDASQRNWHVGVRGFSDATGLPDVLNETWALLGAASTTARPLPEDRRQVLVHANELPRAMPLSMDQVPEGALVMLSRRVKFVEGTADPWLPDETSAEDAQVDTEGGYTLLAARVTIPRGTGRRPSTVVRYNDWDKTLVADLQDRPPLAASLERGHALIWRPRVGEVVLFVYSQQAHKPAWEFGVTLQFTGDLEARAHGCVLPNHAFKVWWWRKGITTNPSGWQCVPARLPVGQLVLVAASEGRSWCQPAWPRTLTA